MPRSITLLSEIALLTCLAHPCAASEKASEEQVRFFEAKIRPLLVEHCQKCHGPEKQKADLRLDSRASILKGGESGPAVVPGEPDKSLLLHVVRHVGDAPRMPPSKKLTDLQIADLVRWVRMGLPYPENATTKKADPRDWWAFQPVRAPAVPKVQDAAWPRTPLDHFILAKLEARGLKPAPPADRRTLIRRATFDLIGLPPTPDEIEAFVKDSSPDAFAKLVDRLLASRHYGERWGRHWLDVARYADSNGLDENVAFGNAWRYRDFVVAAFNEDMPFDQFIQEQLAGDLMPSDGASLRQRRLIATGFLSLGPKVLAEVDEKKMEMDIVDEQIDTVGRSLLGLTLGCARCHDHKFDPFPIADYYGLAGIFKSTRTMEHFRKVARWHENALASGKDAPTAMGVMDGVVADAPIHPRGNHLKAGKIVPRRVPEVLAGDKKPDFDAKRSGRLELARWLVQPENPLTARVLVNRVWRWHFGHGIVRTADNFGALGELPENQPLLDWLAQRLVAEGWSLKALHRAIMLSSTYQMSAVADARTRELDPENRLHGRANVKRLEVEALRDAILAAAGTLDRTMGGSLLHVKNREYFFDHTSRDLTKYDSKRRSLYLPVVRNNVYDVFQLFDYPDPAVPSGDRATTTVAPQALFLLNSDWVMKTCEEMAQALLREPLDDEARIRRLYEKAYGRAPSGSEGAKALALVAELERAAAKREASAERRRLLAWACLCQVVVSANEFAYVQ